MSPTVNGVRGGDGGQLHDLGALKVLDPLLQVQQPSHYRDGLDGGINQRRQPRQGAWTAATGHFRWSPRDIRLNKLPIESKKMPSNSQKHPGLEGRTSAFFAGHPCARWVFSSFTQVITRNPGRGVNCGPPNKYACILT